MISQLITHLKEHGGATLKADNLEHANLKSGYMVSLLGKELKISLKELNIDTLVSYGKMAKALGGYVGAWIDKDTLYLDVSLRVLGKATSLELGRRNKQLAIYSNKDNKVIDVL